MIDSTETVINQRRENVFLILAGFFICAMTLLNVVGITRFIELGPFVLAVGVLPYPLTFLCTDLVCELYGQRRANFLVTVGLILNVFILGIMYIANLAPSAAAASQPPWQTLQLAEQIILPSGDVTGNAVELFELIYACTSGAVFASMVAYIAAQYADVKLFHFFKRLTKGKHLWIRNNFSTMISQMIDSVAVIAITFGAAFFAGDFTMKAILVLIGSNYIFKFSCAVVDTIPFYILVKRLRRYLHLEGMTQVG